MAMRRKKPRLHPSAYVGLSRYFLTFCTAHRSRLFTDRVVVSTVLTQFEHSSSALHFALIAYCFMPDHVHLLVEGCSEGADLATFVHQSKQRSAYAYSRRFGGRLWQPGYYDRALRDPENTASVIRYILDNPVRSGLVQAPGDFPFSGSCRYTWRELLDAVPWRP
jgi:putative transposase